MVASEEQFERSGSCATCPVIRPDTDPRQPTYPPVCDGDRQLLDRYLLEIANLHAELCNDEKPLIDVRQYDRSGRDGASLGPSWADPLAALGGVAPINSRSKAPAVSGSRERPIPINAAEHDLKAPAKVPSLAPSSRGRDATSHHGWPEDQIGHLSTATLLDQWVRDIRDTLYPGHHLPPATVDQLAAWLRARLDRVCDHHPAIAELAEELRTLRGALRSAAGVTEPPPERCDGIPCKRCDMAMLYRQHDADVHCLNTDCSAVYRSDEYQDWVKTLAAEQKIRRHADQPA